MDWIKCKVHHLLDLNFSNAEIGAMYRLQATVAKFERYPTEKEVKSIFRTVERYHEFCNKFEAVSNGIYNKNDTKMMQNCTKLHKTCIKNVYEKVLNDCKVVTNLRQKCKERVEKSRLKAKSVTRYVTDTSNTLHNDDVTSYVTGIDKIRVDKSKEKKYIKKEKVKPPPKFVKPSLSEIKDYLEKYIEEKQLDIPVAVEAEKFESHYEASGWKVGNKSMVCWQAALRGWVLRNNNFSCNNGKKEKKYKSIREVYDEI